MYQYSIGDSLQEISGVTIKGDGGGGVGLSNTVSSMHMQAEKLVEFESNQN